MRVRELLTGNINEDYVNPHTMPSPGSVPSFAGPRAPNTPGNPMPLQPVMPPGGRTSMNGAPPAPGGAPGAMAQNDQVNPHYMEPGTIPSFAGPHPSIPSPQPAPITPPMPAPTGRA